MESIPERDCTVKFRSSLHAKQILNCIPVASPAQLRSFSVWLCHNFATISDELGRNFLHLASTCGKWEIVEWLLKQCNAEVDVKDLESGWTSLHRSFFYGQLTCARILCMHGANLHLADHEGLTPLDIILKDRLPYIEYITSDPSDVYVWGSNFNYNLGIGHSQSRNDPEILEVFHKDFIDIQQVQICKFHSVFLSSTGKVYTCGYGHGGRLGQDTEDISLVPSLVKALGSEPCIQVAAGQDHLLLLLANGQVWSCGLNIYHQLGCIPPMERILVPKAISLKFLKGKAVIGICAARFHSVIYTKDSVYTFGLNAGQLGHPRGDRTQIHPRQVSTLYTEECHLTHVETSDGAIVCATSRGDVYVLHEYQIRKITSRQLEISKLSVIGGHLDSRCDVASVREGGGLELRVALLTKSGKLYLWRQTDPYLRRCMFTSLKELTVSSVHLNHHSICIITSNNEAYLGSIKSFKSKRCAPPPVTLHVSASFKSKPSLGLTVLLDMDDCHIIKVRKLPNIYRATSITSDCKGRNFAVLQSNPKMGLIEVPVVSSPRLQQDVLRLFSETHIHDDFHDVIIKVSKREFAAHKYILASRSEYFRKQFSKDGYEKKVITMENIHSETFEQVLKFLYSNHCDFLTANYEVKWEVQKEDGKKKSISKGSKVSNPIQIVQEISRKFGVMRLAKKLERVKLINGKIYIQDSDEMPRLSFNRKSLSNMSDVKLVSTNGAIFDCHKCILIARLDYFHSMLSTCWAENSQLENLSLPVSSQIMEVLLDYLYTDEAIKVADSDDVEFLCHTLNISDQLLIPRLKEICEVALVRLITLKNAAELLELSSIYNSLQLKRSCMQFICINLAAIIESKVLEVLTVEVMQELSAYYQSLIPSMYRRRISSSKTSISEDLEVIEKQLPISGACHFEKNRSYSHESKSSRWRCNSLRSSIKDNPTIIKEDKKIENLEEDIVFEAIIPDLDQKVNINARVEENEVTVQKSTTKLTDQKPGKWIMHPLPRELPVDLKTIMTEEKCKFTSLQKKTSFPDKKPLSHLSQKQKKMMEASKTKSCDIPVPNSPTNQSSCPWAKLPEQSPPSPSFWEALAKKELQPSSLSREISTPVKNSSLNSERNKNNINSSPVLDTSSNIVISLHDIQKDEEQKLRRSLNPVIKPLHILNIEDQAIEELCALYNIQDNYKEKITVSRVQLEDIASPVWKRRS